MGSETSFRCGDCNESYPDAASLAEHRRDGHKPAPLVAKPDASAGKADSHLAVASVAPSEPAEDKAEPDEMAASELVLSIENDDDLYRQQHVPIIKSLMRKRKNGTYDFDGSVKRFSHLADEGARRHTRRFGMAGKSASEVFDKPTRMLAARNLAESFRSEADLGNYDDMAGKAEPEQGKADSETRSANKAVNAINNAMVAAGAAAYNANSAGGKEAWVDIATDLRHIYERAKGALKAHGKADDGCPNCGHADATEGKATESTENKMACPNCDQWARPTRNGYYDCLNECAKRGFAPKVEAVGKGKAGGEGDFGIYAMGYNGERGRKVAARSTELDAMMEAERLAEAKGRGYMVWHAQDGHIGEAGKAMGCPGCGCSGARHNEGGCMDCDDCKLAVGRIQVRGKSDAETEFVHDIDNLVKDIPEKPSAAMVTEMTAVLTWKAKPTRSKFHRSGPSVMSLQLPRVALLDYSQHSDTPSAMMANQEVRDRIGEHLKKHFKPVIVWQPDDDMRAISNDFHARYAQLNGKAETTEETTGEPETEEPTGKPIRAHFGKAGDFDPDSFHIARNYDGRGFDAIFASSKGGKADAEMMLQSIVFPGEGKFNAKTASKAARSFAKEFDLGDPVLE